MLKGKNNLDSHQIGTPILRLLSELNRCIREDSRALDEELATEIKFQDLCEDFKDALLILKARPDDIACGYQFCQISSYDAVSNLGAVLVGTLPSPII